MRRPYSRKRKNQPRVIATWAACVLALTPIASWAKKSQDLGSTPSASAKNPMTPLLECFKGNTEATSAFQELDFAVTATEDSEGNSYAALVERNDKKNPPTRTAVIFSSEGIQSFEALQGPSQQFYVLPTGKPDDKAQELFRPGHKRSDSAHGVYTRTTESKVLQSLSDLSALPLNDWTTQVFPPTLRVVSDPKDHAENLFKRYGTNLHPVPGEDWHEEGPPPIRQVTPNTHASTPARQHASTPVRRSALIAGLGNRFLRYSDKASAESVDSVLKRAQESKNSGRRAALTQQLKNSQDEHSEILKRIEAAAKEYNLPRNSSIGFEIRNDRSLGLLIDERGEQGNLRNSFEESSPRFRHIDAAIEFPDFWKAIQPSLSEARQNWEQEQKIEREQAQENKKFSKELLQAQNSELVQEGLLACKKALEKNQWNEDEEFKELYRLILAELREIDTIKKNRSTVGVQPSRQSPNQNPGGADSAL